MNVEKADKAAIRKREDHVMITTKERLERGYRVMAVIGRRRAETGDPRLGAGIERFILNRELNELTEEILMDPGAMEQLLVRRK
jgi:hypothetical protein